MAVPAVNAMAANTPYDLENGAVAWKNSDGSILVYGVEPPYTTFGTIKADGTGAVKLPSGQSVFLQEGQVKSGTPPTPKPPGASGTPRPSQSAAAVNLVGTGAYGSTPGAAAGTPGSLVTRGAFDTSTHTLGADSQPLYGTTKDPYAGQNYATRGDPNSGLGTYSNLFTGNQGQPLQPGTKFPGGWVDPGGNRHFLGRDDEGGPLGRGAVQTDPSSGYTYLGNTDLGTPGGRYAGAQPYRFTTGKQYGGPALNVDYGSGAQGDPTDNAGSYDEGPGYPKGKDDWMKWVQGTHGGGQYFGGGTGGGTGGGLDDAPPGAVTGGAGEYATDPGTSPGYRGGTQGIGAGDAGTSPVDPDRVRREAALAWAQGRINDREYDQLCEQFAENAYGTGYGTPSQGQFPSAKAGAQGLGATPTPTPRAGDLAYFNPDRSNNQYGHVGLVTGSSPGDFISATAAGVRHDNYQTDPYWKGLYAGSASPPDTWTGRPPGGGGSIGGDPAFGYTSQQYEQPPASGGGGQQAVGGGGSYFTSGSTTNLTGDWAPLANLVLRSDTPTGIGSAGIPPEYQNLLKAALQQGIIKAGSDGWNFLQQNFGWSPQSVGGQATTNAPAGTGGTGGMTGAQQQQYGGTLPEGTDTPLGKITGGLPGGFGIEWQKILQKMQEDATQKAIDEAKLTGKFNGLDTLDAQKLQADIAHQAAQDAVAKLAEDRQLREQVFSEAYRNATLSQNEEKIKADIANNEAQVRLKQQELDDARRSGDLDRALKAQEDLQNLQTKTAELTGYLQNPDGSQTATLAMQQFMADQQQKAYERAANPAMAFENELARGATGWNTPGVNPNGAGIPGMTAPGQTMDQFMAAGGYAQSTQPGTGMQQAGGYGYGMYPQAYPNPDFTGNAYTQQAMAQQTAAAQQAAQQQQAAQAQQAQAVQTAQQAVNPGLQVGASTTSTTSTGATGAADSSNPFASDYSGGTTAGQTGTNQSGQPALGDTLVRTPAAINAFKAGTGMSSAGGYGAAGNTLDWASQAAITPDQVRMQNLKATRRMSPVARGVIQSFAAAGGTNADTFKQFTDAGVPKTGSAGQSYGTRARPMI